MPNQKRKFKVAEFISKIVRDPNAPPDTLLLQGFLGDSSEEGHIRLYLDAQLSDYVEIPEDAVLHTQEIPDSILGETYIWIAKDADLIHGKAGPTRFKAKFLEGRIQQQFLGGAAEMGAEVPGQLGPAPTPPFTIWQPQCLTMGFACPSLAPYQCHSRGLPLCPTRLPYHCHSIPPQLCPTFIIQQCPSVYVRPCGPSVAQPCISLPMNCPSVISPCISHQVLCPTQSPQLCPVASGAAICGPIEPGPIDIETFAAAAPAPSQFQQCPSQAGYCKSGDIYPCPSVAPDICQSAGCPPVKSVPIWTCPTRWFCPTQNYTACPSVPVYQCPSVLCPSKQVNVCPSQKFTCPDTVGWTCQ